MALESINPATGEVVARYEEMKPQQVEEILQQAHQAFQPWRQTPFARRAALLREAARVLRERAQEYARLMALEMGKPVRDGRAEVEKCAWACEYYAENGETFLAPELVETDASKSYVSYQPLGVVLAVMPWNFPFWQVIRFAAPGLMAGNVGVLKHASNVSGCALALEELFREAGFPESTFRTLLVGSKQVEAIIENRHVMAVTLTGSTPAGRAVAAKAGAMLKKTVLELGGSDPYVVLEDADLAAAVETCVAGRMINGGQSCIAAKRFIVVDAVREKCQARVVAQMASYQAGDPLDEATRMGPLARVDLRDELHAQVQGSIRRGARCLLGGKVPPGPGAYYPPTVLTDVGPGMPAYHEELFGPVATIIAARDEEDAIRIANDTAFGLGAAVFTQDVARGERIAREELQAGSCFVNAFVKSDPRLPFGGVKESGYGRELSYHGIREFVNVKTVWIR